MTATDARQARRLRLRRPAASRISNSPATALTAAAAEVAGMPSRSVIARTRSRSDDHTAPISVSRPTSAANAATICGERARYPAWNR